MLTPLATGLSSPRRALKEDPVRAAMRNLAEALPLREDNAVLVDFLEDDLREGMEALSDVQDYFGDVLESLSGRLSPISLCDASDEQRVLQKLGDLEAVVLQIRKRMSQAAARLQASR